jgi:PAS domain S-box-containing protein
LSGLEFEDAMPRLTVTRSETDRGHSALAITTGRDLSGSIAELAEELLSQAEPSIPSATRALQQLRRRAGATDALLWALERGTARRLLSASRQDGTAPVVDLSAGEAAIDRVRTMGTLVSRYGDASGLEGLVPPGLRSFVAAGATSRGALVGVLVLGWANGMPKWNGRNLRDARVAAGLLAAVAWGPDGTHADAGIAGTAPDAASDRAPDRSARRVEPLEHGHRQELFQRLADALALPLCMLAADGRLLFANQRWAADAGARQGDQARGTRKWTEAFHPADRRRAQAVFRAAMSRGEGFQIELRLNADGSPFRWAACTGSPVHGPDGRLEALVVLAVDITARRAEASLIAAQEHERSRIARDLHDDFGQRLAVLASKLELAARAAGSPRRVAAALGDARRNVQDLATSVHNLSHELHPAKLRLLGLGPTLHALCRTLSADHGVPIACDYHGISVDVPEEPALCAFRLAQEALHNAVKHSKAHHIAVTVDEAAPSLIVRIVDDGVGFDPMVSQTAGIGLMTMRERVELLGGRLAIESAEGRGTTIEAEIPLAEGRATAAGESERTRSSGPYPVTVHRRP